MLAVSGEELREDKPRAGGGHRLFSHVTVWVHPGLFLLAVRVSLCFALWKLLCVVTLASPPCPHLSLWSAISHLINAASPSFSLQLISVVFPATFRLRLRLSWTDCLHGSAPSIWPPSLCSEGHRFIDRPIIDSALRTVMSWPKQTINRRPVWLHICLALMDSAAAAS